MPRFALFALAFLLACDDAADPVAVRSAPIDAYPDDPFAFGCDLPPVDLAELTPQSCAIMLAACVDAAIGPCGGLDAKDCAGAVDDLLDLERLASAEAAAREALDAAGVAPEDLAGLRVDEVLRLAAERLRRLAPTIRGVAWS